MTLLIVGLLLWFASHLLKRLAPGLRAAMGDVPGKLVVSVLTFLALYLMVKGFRAADFIEVWSPPAFLTHVNNLAMLAAVYLMTLGYAPGTMRTQIRHPLLTATKTWAIAHLLVNGDLASIMLFGGIFVWALVDLILINRQVPVWNRPAKGPVRNDLIHAAASLALFALITWIHTWLGHWPFG